MGIKSLAETLARYSWYHRIEVAPGIITPGRESYASIQEPVMRELCRQNLLGKRVLDIGCRDGLFSFAAEHMGASEVVGIDNDLSPGAVEFLIPYFNSKVQMHAANLYDFTTAKAFDFVLCAGVLYHLRLPFLGLKRIADATQDGGIVMLETAIFVTPLSVPLLYCPAPEDSPYDPTSVSFYNDAGLTTALRSFGFANIECRNVLSDEGTSHANWDGFLSSAPRKDFSGIVRAVYTAKKTGPQNAHLNTYWFDLHTLESSYADNRKFLEEFGKAHLLDESFLAYPSTGNFG